jgi:phage shock protein A
VEHTGRRRHALTRLQEVRRKVPRLWDSASTALAQGNEELARLALRRRQVLLGELACLDQALGSDSSRPRLLERIDAADRLLDASIGELARLCATQFRLPPTVHLDPVVETQLAHMSKRLRR